MSIPVLIAGMGVVSSIGKNTSENYHSLMAEKGGHWKNAMAPVLPRRRTSGGGSQSRK